MVSTPTKWPACMLQPEGFEAGLPRPSVAAASAAERSRPSARPDVEVESQRVAGRGSPMGAGAKRIVTNNQSLDMPESRGMTAEQTDPEPTGGALRQPRPRRGREVCPSQRLVVA